MPYSPCTQLQLQAYLWEPPVPVAGVLVKIWENAVCQLKKYPLTHKKPQQTRTPLKHIYYGLENTKYQIHLDSGANSAVKYNLKSTAERGTWRKD